MPTERTRQQQQAKDASPPDESYYGRDGQDPSDPNGAVRGAERSGSSGIKAKLAAKWNRRRTDDSEKKVRNLIHCELIRIAGALCAVEPVTLKEVSMCQKFLTFCS